MDTAVTNKTIAALAFAAGLLTAGAAVAADPEYISIRQEIDVNRAPAVVWAKVGNYCDLGAWLKVKCVYTSGTGDIGTVRRIADRIDEVMVAKTTTSYTYAQPLSPISYHGTVEIVPQKRGSKIIYTLFYDVAPLPTQAAKDADRARRAAQFKTALDNMKALAEAK
jgi:hypothetical protein